MDNYIIRFATEKDIPAIMRFIGEYWRKNHILSKDRELFEWQYINRGKLNMIIGEDRNSCIQAILGYIPYDEDTKKDICLALWKAREGTAFLGVKLLLFLIKEEPHRNIFCNGINMRTSAGIYHRLGWTTGKFKQYYRLCTVTDYKIAKINIQHIPIIKENSEIELIRANTMQELLENSETAVFNRESVPCKSKEYISKRYFEHPAYSYLIYSVKEGERKSRAAIVLRVQECNSSKALRVIDVVGEHSVLGSITHCLDIIAEKIGVEYIDMYETGLDDEMLKDAGWLEVGQDSNVIPNYFAPYEACNVDIYYSTTDDKIVLFKGDGDQDRPN